jgi:hypothetical protein
MVMGDDMNYINPAAGRRNYEKHPERVFRLKQDVLVPAGTVFTRAPLERGGYDRIEGIVALGNDATAYLNLPLRVAEIDAAEWFEVGAERQQGAAGAAGAAGAELTPSGTHVPPALAPEKK